MKDSSQQLPRGIRNNNPGNIVKSSIDWEGLSPDQSADERFAVFQSPEHGIKAMSGLLDTYQSKHGLKTIGEIINRYAPPSENATTSYAQTVAQKVGVDPNQPVNLKNDPETKAKLMKAMIEHENGYNPYDDNTIMSALGGGETAQQDMSYATMNKPTLENFRSNQATPYSEDSMTSLDNKVPTKEIVASQIGGLKGAPTMDKATAGAKLGAAIGFAVNGSVGGIIGSGIGAFAGRALGHIIDGQHAQQQEEAKVSEVFETAGLSKDMKFQFDDGVSFPATFDPNVKLRNTSAAVSGKKERSITEVDASNPFTNRTTAVAMPLALFLTNSISKDKDSKTKENTVNLLVNALQSDAPDIETIYTRARQLAKKLGVKEDAMRTYFASIKEEIPPQKAIVIKQGLDVLYG